jgi:glycosyltransferase involved in cell wall biosynthesis
MKKLGEFGVDANLTFVGGGDDGIQFFKNLAEKLQLSEKVSFTGRIGDREEYLDVIKDHDIFVFPSHSEGLPRVLLEVMATGMLCVASNVDGIPEILGSDDIFDYRDIEGMSNRILELSNNTDLEKTLSRENNDMARRFLSSELKIRYDEFYQKVRILIDQKRGADA